MGILRRLITGHSTDLATGPQLQGVERWSRPIAGFAAHAGRIHVPSNSLFLADGWGVTHSSLRFRRIDLATGAELASVRTGTAIRCFAVLRSGDELIGATDSKLLRLGLARLDERQRWDRRIPRYADSIVVRDGYALVANWTATQVSIVDLETGHVRRRPSPSMPLLVDGAALPILVGGSQAGGRMAIDPTSAVTTTMEPAPPAVEAVVGPDGASLWTTVGTRGTYTRSASGGSVAPPNPSRRLRREWLDGREPPVEYRLPEAAGPLVHGQSELWLGADRFLVAVPLPVGSAPARVFAVPAGQSIAWFDPDARLVIAITRRISPDEAVVTAFDIDGPPAG